MNKKSSWIENQDGPWGAYYKVVFINGKKVRLFVNNPEISMLFSDHGHDEEKLFKKFDEAWDNSLENKSLEIMDYIEKTQDPNLSLDKSGYFVYGRVLETEK